MQNLADFRGKKVLIMGLGLHGGGVGAAVFFARLGSRVIVTDLKRARELAPSLASLKRFRSITYHLGGHRKEDFQTADVVIKNPGVPDHSPFLGVARRAGAEILSDVEVFFGACPAPIIGVTGTKGKSTATWLIGEFLKRGSRKRVWVGGNIRRSMLEFLPRVRKGDWVVLELSSFQLDSLKHRRMSPAFALITNIFPDHLNRYPSMRAYVASKAAIVRYQRVSKDRVFLNHRDPALMRLVRGSKARVARFDPVTVLRPFERFIAGSLPSYHRANIAGAVTVARHLGIGKQAIRRVLSSFLGLPGRMERIRMLHGASFINDTTATNPTAAAAAVAATKRRIGNRRLILIAGGYDKGLPAGAFARAIANSVHTLVFLPGTATKKMKLEMRNSKFEEIAGSKGPNILGARSMRRAVRLAAKHAEPGDVVLLSPGAASFGLFQNEFDRGNQFVKAVRALR